ncbi:MAG TPA: hypothetical protein VNA16_10805 [Abditibacteriaceae bacterium]|nr:hypothetical protein [Abditibacteriaceae bacterium]
MAEIPSAEDDAAFDDEVALRWRRVILALSENLMDAASQRSELSPILLGALHNALDQLLLHGEEGDLEALEEWLMMEAPSGTLEQAEVRPPTHAWPGPERRAGPDRRICPERRTQPDRRDSD